MPVKTKILEALGWKGDEDDFFSPDLETERGRVEAAKIAIEVWNALQDPKPCIVQSDTTSETLCVHCTYPGEFEYYLGVGDVFSGKTPKQAQKLLLRIARKHLKGTDYEVIDC